MTVSDPPRAVAPADAAPAADEQQAAPAIPPAGWTEQARPPSLFRRFTFDDYGSLRRFLDQAAALSEAEGLYPDMSFGRTYVNVTVRPATPDDGALGESERRLAARLSDLVADADA